MANRLLQAGALTCASYLMMVLNQSPVDPSRLSLKQSPAVVQIGAHLGNYLGGLIDRTRFN